MNPDTRTEPRIPVPEPVPFTVLNRERLLASSDVELFGMLMSMDDRVPRSLIEVCLKRESEMLPLVVDFVTDAGIWRPDLPDHQWWGILHCVHLLGSMSGTGAGGPLFHAYWHINVEDHGIGLWDWLEGSWPVLFRPHYGEWLPKLRGIAENRSHDWYARVQAMYCVAYEAENRSTDRLGQVLDRLAVTIDKDSEDPRYCFRAACLLLMAARPEHRKLLNRLARLQEGGAGEAPVFSLDDVARAYDAPRRKRVVPENDPLTFYDASSIAERQKMWRDAQNQEMVEPDPDQPVMMRITP